MLWEALEQIARNNKAFYDSSYQREKSRYLEEKVFANFSRLFPEHEVYRRLSYPDPDKSDNSTAELDLAIRWGPFVLLIEAKAARFRMESQLGDAARLRSDLKANVEDAFQQARRAERYIRKVPQPVFREILTGRTLRFDRDDIRKIYLITVSQHHLAGVANRLATIKDLRLFLEGEYPFAICLSDLENIVEACPQPDIFLHYVERRLQVQHETVEILADELDLFGAYLDTRLQADRLWRNHGAEVNGLALDGFSRVFDKLVQYKRGEIEAPPEIRLKIPEEIARLLNELRGNSGDGARWISFALLSMSDTNLAGIAQAMKDIEQADLAPGRFRSLVHEADGLVICILATQGASTTAVYERTFYRTRIEKYRRKAAISFGIGIMKGNTRLLHGAIWMEGPWVHDSVMEEIIASEPVSLPINRKDLPSRNSPCFCGSKKKFKKCCLPKIEALKGRRGDGQG